MLETDGPYGEGSCASKAHNHHVDLGDSVYWQTKLQVHYHNSNNYKVL